MKRKFRVKDLIISTLFCFFLSFYLIPNGIAFFLDLNNKVPHNIKSEILNAGKRYIDKNNVDEVSLRELYMSGYLLEKKELDQMNCFNSITKVKKDNNLYSLQLECTNERTTLSLLVK